MEVKIEGSFESLSQDEWDKYLSVDFFEDMPDLSNEKIFPGGIKVKALFTPDMKWRLVEEFGPHCFTESDDGRLLFTADYTDMENLVTWLMTFGAKAEVLEPAEARDIIRRNAEETLKIYGGLA